MMVLDRYLFSELLKVVTAIMLVLCVIMASLMFVKLLERVAIGDMNPQVVFPLMGLQVTRYLARSLPAGFFLAVLLVLGRMYRDNEMTALAACGVGGWKIYRAVGVMALPLALMTAWLAVWVQPWTTEQIERIKLEQQEAVAELAGVQPGRFNEFRNGDLVFYVEAMDKDNGRMRNIFIQNRQQGKLGLVSASEGEHGYDAESGDHYVTLYQGKRYEGVAGRGDFVEASFDSYTLRIAEGGISKSKDSKAKSTAELYDSDDLGDIAEFWERISFPLSLLTLTLVAIPLSRSAPRQTIYTRMLFAFLVYFSFINLSGVSVDWLENGVTPVWLGIWWVQVVFLLMAGLLALLDSRLLRRLQRRRPVA